VHPIDLKQKMHSQKAFHQTVKRTFKTQVHSATAPKSMNSLRKYLPCALKSSSRLNVVPGHVINLIFFSQRLPHQPRSEQGDPDGYLKPRVQKELRKKDSRLNHLRQESRRRSGHLPGTWEVKTAILKTDWTGVVAI
jgi:hypothetical protein